MLDDEGSVPSNREEKENSVDVQQAFVGEPADDAEGFQVMSRDTEIAGDAAVMHGPTVVDQPDPDAVVSWTWEDIIKEQKDDKDIGPILDWINRESEQPPWERVALQSAETKALWNMWPRLAVRDGVLKRRFEEIDGLNNNWQIILPKRYCYRFMQLAHEGMTGGHLAHAKTASGIQSRAYWPT